MNVSLIDKDLFASLLRYGEVVLPDYSYSVISEDLPIEDALKEILCSGNPIEYPSQYIIVLYDCPDNSNILPIYKVKELVATDSDGWRLFTSQFREDLIIQPEGYKAVFQEYLEDDFQKARIKKGIVSFRTLCGLDVTDNYDEEVSIIYRGLSNRIRYRHHFQLPPEERDEPYALMISYDRHAPYSRGWVGYFCDVIETFCYHRKPDLGYSETVIEGTGIYKLINALPQNAASKQINEAVKDEKFTQLCNEFFNRLGGYLVPYIFFILRDRFRNSESFSEQANLIQRIKDQFPEAFDTASIFVGGFFGYEKFYDDYYSKMQLPILKNLQHPCSPLSVPAKAESTLAQLEVETKENRANPSDDLCVKVETVSNEQILVEDSGELKDNSGEEIAALFNLDGEMIDEDTKEANSEQSVFVEGNDLFKKLYYAIDNCLNDGKEKTDIINGIERYRNDNRMLEEIQGLLVSPIENKKNKNLIKERLNLSRYPVTMKKLREHLQKSEIK